MSDRAVRRGCEEAGIEPHLRIVVGGAEGVHWHRTGTLGKCGDGE